LLAGGTIIIIIYYYYYFITEAEQQALPPPRHPHDFSLLSVFFGPFSFLAAKFGHY
jgi:hypothetical protein